MRLVGNANDVAAVGKKTHLLAELLDSGDVNATRFAPTQRLRQVAARLDAAHILVVQEPLRGHKQLACLVIQVLAVNNKHDGRIAQLLAASKHHQTREEEHGVRLAAASGAKVRTALAVALGTQVLADVVEHLRRCEVLRVAADYLSGVLAVVWEEDEVANDCQEAGGRERALDHGVKGTDAVRHLVDVIGLVPGVKIRVRSEHGANLAVGAVADRGDAAVLEQTWDVARVANGDLLPRVVDGLILLYGGLEFEDGERYAVHEAQKVGAAGAHVLDRVLVHDEEVVVGDVVEVDVLDMNGRLVCVLSRKCVPLVDEPEHSSAPVVERGRGDTLELAHERLELALGQVDIGIAASKARLQPILHEWLIEATVQQLAVGIAPTHAIGVLLLEQLDDCPLKLTFSEFAVFEFAVRRFHSCLLYVSRFLDEIGIESARQVDGKVGHRGADLAFSRTGTVCRHLVTNDRERQKNAILKSLGLEALWKG